MVTQDVHVSTYHRSIFIVYGHVRLASQSNTIVIVDVPLHLREEGIAIFHWNLTKHGQITYLAIFVFDYSANSTLLQHIKLILRAIYSVVCKDS